MKHEVAFNIGTHTVVCSCGEYYKSDVFSSAESPYRSAVKKWADHLKEINGNN